MRRREILTMLGAVAATWPLTARAQQPMPVVGCLNSGSPATHAERMRMFRRGLGEMGYVEGKNVAIEYRWVGDDFSLFPALAAELVRRPVSAIAVAGVPGTIAAKAATTTIPIVFNMGGDPVKLGFVESLNKPGGNITGITTLGLELEPKRLELARELLPSAKGAALLVNPTTPNAAIITKSVQAAAHTLGLELHVLHASAARDLDAVFANFGKLQAGVLVIGNDGVFINQVEQLGRLSARHAVPAIFQFRDFAAAGGMMSYGGSLTEQNRLSGIYVGRILKGEKPADLPVQQETKVELIVNLKTAKALGITVPNSLLVRADEVIE